MDKPQCEALSCAPGTRCSECLKGGGGYGNQEALETTPTMIECIGLVITDHDGRDVTQRVTGVDAQWRPPTNTGRVTYLDKAGNPILSMPMRALDVSDGLDETSFRRFPVGAQVTASGTGVDTVMTMGQIAYEAYCGDTNWKSLVTGADLPQFANLKPEIKKAWEAAAKAVVEQFRR